MHVLIVVGVNADEHREGLGVDVVTAEDGAGWHSFEEPQAVEQAAVDS